MDTKKIAYTSTPVRIGNELYRRVFEIATENRRKVRQQVELMIEEALERLEQPAQLETRKGARRG